ncbi:MAG TPA: general secretion pathway protein GspB [Methylobacter sp.]|jgi:general secretion pathway protein B
MSFILNALRKSEQERQALQSETVTDKIILAQPPQNKSNTMKLFVFLILANVLIIACFVWFIRDNLISMPDATAPTISPQLPAQETKLEPKATIKSIQPKRPAQKAEFETTSIAELIDNEKPEPAQLPVTKKPVADAIKQPAIAKNIKLSMSATPAIAAARIQPDESETLPVTTGIPFLNDLPKEFRQTLPKFTINVFVYSQAPEERFIMIDMVKYKTGQQIKDAMLLKEILPDSFVVDYQNRTFKIRRP